MSDAMKQAHEIMHNTELSDYEKLQQVLRLFTNSKFSDDQISLWAKQLLFDKANVLNTKICWMWEDCYCTADTQDKCAIEYCEYRRINKWALA